MDINFIDFYTFLLKQQPRRLSHHTELNALHLFSVKKEVMYSFHDQEHESKEEERKKAYARFTARYCINHKTCSVVYYKNVKLFQIITSIICTGLYQKCIMLLFRSYCCTVNNIDDKRYIIDYLSLLLHDPLMLHDNGFFFLSFLILSFIFNFTIEKRALKRRQIQCLFMALS